MSTSSLSPESTLSAQSEEDRPVTSGVSQMIADRSNASLPSTRSMYSKSITATSRDPTTGSERLIKIHNH